MFFRSLLGSLLLVFASLCYGCRRDIDDYKRAQELLEDLEENQAYVSFALDGEEFYSGHNLFSGEIHVSRSTLSMTVTSPEGARSIINFGGSNWFMKKPLKTEIFERGEAVASVKVGKIIDPEKMIGEGYMLTEGEIDILRFSPNQMIMKVKGKAGKYSDFQQPDTLYSIKGFIVYKKPVIKFGDITEKEIFGTTSSYQ